MVFSLYSPVAFAKCSQAFLSPPLSHPSFSTPGTFLFSHFTAHCFSIGLLHGFSSSSHTITQDISWSLIINILFSGFFSSWSEVPSFSCKLTISDPVLHFPRLTSPQFPDVPSGWAPATNIFCNHREEVLFLGILNILRAYKSIPSAMLLSLLHQRKRCWGFPCPIFPCEKLKGGTHRHQRIRNENSGFLVLSMGLSQNSLVKGIYFLIALL